MANAREVLDAITRLEHAEVAVPGVCDLSDSDDSGYALEDKVADLSTVIRFVAARAISLERQLSAVEAKLAVIERRLLFTQ